MWNGKDEGGSKRVAAGTVSVGDTKRAITDSTMLLWHARRVASAAIFAVFAFLTTLANPVMANDALIAPGDGVVTGFSGTEVEADVPVDVHPLDRTFIDLDGAAAQVFDLNVLGTTARGQLSDVPSKLQIKARDSGQVFGVTLDDGEGSDGVPNAYLAATSMFGLHIVKPRADGKLDRVLIGEAGAEWMPGQFGMGPVGTPGSIWKVDGRSGAVSLFANIAKDGRENSGPGLGNLTFDATSRQFFVSDLETGLIHRLARDGKLMDTFDHGTTGRESQGLDAVADDASRRMSIESASFNSEDPATWGYADERRRVFGLAVNKQRLYYGLAEGPSVWSVGLKSDGGFADDARIELDIKDSPPGTNVTDILFDDAGRMILSQRGGAIGSYDYTAFATAQTAQVLRYTWDAKDGRWRDAADEYAIGLAPEHRASDGGIALNYGYDKFGNANRAACRQTLWTTGTNLRGGDDVVRVSTGGAKVVQGLQGNYLGSVLPENAPPYQSWFTDYDNRFDDPDSSGHIGDIAIFAPCEPQAEPPPGDTTYIPPLYLPPLDDPGLVIDKKCYPGAIGGKIRCTISVRNLSDGFVSEDIKITDMTKTMFGPGAGALLPIVDVSLPMPGILCAATPTPDFWCTIPAPLLPGGEVVAIDVWIDTFDLALAGNTGFRNCAVLKHPDGFGKACAEGGTDIIVEKLGPGVCLPGGTCKFGLSISNAGLMPYNGDVLLADAMFIGGDVPVLPVTAVNPPIACSAGNTTQLPFTCVTHLALAPGEQQIHWVDVTMPAPGGYWAENCFGALDPALIAPGPLPPALVGGGGGDNPSCVWVWVPAPIAAKKSDPITRISTPIPPPRARCEDGRSLRSDGTCPCPRGSDWNARNWQCEYETPRCHDFRRLRDDGSCCPRGTVYDDKRDRCFVPPQRCPDKRRERNDGTCCPFGTQVTANGRRCAPIDRDCPSDTKWNFTLQQCVPLRPLCGPGESYNWRNRKCERIVVDVCRFPMRRDVRTGRCIPVDVQCPTGQRYDAYDRRCETIDTGGKCPDGSPRLAGGGCRCPLNRPWNSATGQCGRPGTLTPPGGVSDKICPRGQRRVGRVCVPDRVDPQGGGSRPVICGPGERRVGRDCVPVIKPDIKIKPEKIRPPKIDRLPIKPPRIRDIDKPNFGGPNRNPNNLRIQKLDRGPKIRLPDEDRKRGGSGGGNFSPKVNPGNFIKQFN